MTGRLKGATSSLTINGVRIDRIIEWDSRKFGGQAAIACGCGCVSLAGWNFCP
jgi:hypothetical protein